MRYIISKPLCWLLCCLVLTMALSCDKKPTEPDLPKLIVNVITIQHGSISPLPGAKVTLGDVTSTTNENGSCIFKREVGRYNVQCSKDGYTSYTTELNFETSLTQQVPLAQAGSTGTIEVSNYTSTYHGTISIPVQNLEYSGVITMQTLSENVTRDLASGTSSLVSILEINPNLDKYADRVSGVNMIFKGLLKATEIYNALALYYNGTEWRTFQSTTSTRKDIYLIQMPKPWFEVPPTVSETNLNDKLGEYNEIRSGLRADQLITEVHNLLLKGGELSCFLLSAGIYANVVPEKLIAERVVCGLVGIDDGLSLLLKKVNEGSGKIYVRKSLFNGTVDPLILIVVQPNPNPQPITSVEIYPTTVTLDKGSTCQFYAYARDAQGNVVGVPKIWSCSFGSIDQNGLYTADYAGSGTVTVSLGDAWPNVVPSSAAVIVNGQYATVIISTTPVTGDIFREGQLVGHGSCLVSLAVGSIHTFSFGNVTGYLTPDPITVTIPFEGVVRSVVYQPTCTPDFSLNCPGSVPINSTMQICWTPACADVSGWTYSITLDGNVWIGQQTQTCVSTTFPSPGNHTICVTLNDGKGHVITKCCTVTIYDPVPNQAPNACFSINPSSGTTETTFNFDAGCSTDDKTLQANLQVRWQIDGSWTGFTTTKTMSKKWTSYGTKTVIVEVKDGEGLTDQDTKNIQVDYPGPTTGTIVVNPNPSTASWDITPGGYAGTGYQSIPDVTPGEYHITWHALSGYDTPAGEYKTLNAGGTITFSVNYSPSSSPIDFTPTTIPEAALQQYYEVTFVSTGGTPGYGVAFSLSGTTPDLTLTNNADGSATLAGTPNVAGSYSFTILLVDKGNLSNKKYRDYTLNVQPAVGQLVVDPTILNFGSEITVAYSTASNANNNGPITFNVSSNKSWLTTLPSTTGTTRTEIKVMVNRTGLADGNYTGRVTLSSSAGTAYIDVQMAVTTTCVMSPNMISPISGQNLDLSDPVFSWDRVCQDAGQFYMVIVDSRSYYGNVIFWQRFDYRDTYIRYTGSNLQPNRTYYWYLTDISGTAVTGIESFYVIP
ncbi:MAG: carboxypeptidase-like regulatory domain-containing protein [Patescibacteria group bacterium]